MPRVPGGEHWAANARAASCDVAVFGALERVPNLQVPKYVHLSSLVFHWYIFGVTGTCGRLPATDLKLPNICWKLPSVAREMWTKANENWRLWKIWKHAEWSKHYVACESYRISDLCCMFSDLIRVIVSTSNKSSTNHHKHPAGLKTALVVVHFLQNQKMLNHKNCVFTVVKWWFSTWWISLESKKQSENAWRILCPFLQNATRVAFFARPFFHLCLPAHEMALPSAWAKSLLALDQRHCHWGWRWWRWWWWWSWWWWSWWWWWWWWWSWWWWWWKWGWWWDENDDGDDDHDDDDGNEDDGEMKMMIMMMMMEMRMMVRWKW